MLIHLCGIPRRPRGRFGVCALLGEFRARRSKRVLRFTGVERGSRVSQFGLNPRGEWVRGPEDAPRGPFQVIERLNALTEIVERGTGVLVERPRVIQPGTIVLGRLGAIAPGCPYPPTKPPTSRHVSCY